ncbi:MAG: DUF4256 domain-containing protein [Gemmatimonadaceae bacterium]|nr:DUF4256 domain-containing protein [Gemmatimonadaceae bacterium]
MKAAEKTALLATLRARFDTHAARHKGITWEQVHARLEASKTALDVLKAMEDTGGEPDVIACDAKSGAVTFCDCSAESPSGRRSLCYDQEALDARKEAKPVGSAVGMAAAMGVQLLDEAQYAALQQLGSFDLKTSSWLLTPPAVRKLGGSIFGDRRYGRVFTYHNGAQSYYAARGWRGQLVV